MRRVLTSFGTVLYFDVGAGCVRHGREGVVPPNLSLAVSGNVASFMLGDSFSGAPLACDGTGTLRIRQDGEDGNRDSFTLNHVDTGAMGIRHNNLYLSAQPSGTVEFSRDWCREWEQFRVFPVLSAPRRAGGRRSFYVELDCGHGMSRMAEIRKRHDLPPFYIQAPPYTPFSGGVVVLHLLCHFLNHLGVEAYVHSRGLSGTLHTPQFTPEVGRAHAAAGLLPVCVYPEIVLGNEMAGTRVVRFLLNRPGRRGLDYGEALPAFWASDQRQTEYILDYANEFKHPGLSSRTMFVPIVDDRAFYSPPATTERRGFLVYSHRVQVTPEMIPSWASPYTMIDMKSPRLPAELSQLYRASEGLVVFERTGAQLEAAMCGCPVVAIPGFDLFDIPMRALFGNHGVGWGDDIAQLDWARLSLPLFQESYLKVASSFLDDLADCVDTMMTFFSQGRHGQT